ncbi:hypothetical protein SAMN02745146_3146 [Hymenobacter daecheongensis DSM 21074]|uniref:DUF5723 domain-containing protein n=1 Tax=Hymenobacter daecheongensis DSM 21074 TaxID=1121955 RepID=A0A1M6J8W2_9BACT|nr:DUF5723 family protein [Hymenobacter daecheongensis]SHJ43129.1 hypothetical protein SAMN02745146_3146 [Hymenobacter daecheongensis DSM 21074]
MLKSVLVFSLSMAAGNATAQQLFNSTRSNYSGLTGLSWNPAHVADNRYVVQLHLLAVDAHATNTAYRYTGAWSPQKSDEDLDLSKEFLTRRESDKAKLISAGLNVRGPGLMVRVGPKRGLAFGTRVRSAMQGNGVSENLLRNAVDGFKERGRSTDNTFNLNMNLFAEWNLTYGQVVLDNSEHFLKAGLTVKRLIGFGSAYLQSSKADYEVVTRTTATGDSTFRLNRLEAAFGYSNPRAFDDVTVENAVDLLTASGAPGAGWGADIGVVYENRPNLGQYRYIDKKGVERLDNSRNKYRYRLSASITDLGGLRYDKDAAAYNDIRATNTSVSEADLEGIDFDNFDTRLNRILRTQTHKRENRFRAGLPTALNLDVDYCLRRHLYANLSVSQGLRGRYAVGMRTFSFVALTPRFESNWLELAAPISLINGYQTFAYGVMLRMGGVTIGSNDLAPVFDSSKPYGFNGYAQLALSLANKGYKAKKHGPARLQKPGL